MQPASHGRPCLATGCYSTNGATRRRLAWAGERRSSASTGWASGATDCVNMYRIVRRSWGDGTSTGLKITHGRHAIRAWARAIEPLTGGSAPRRPIAPSIKGAVDLATPLPGYSGLSLVRLLDRLSLCLFAYRSLASSASPLSPWPTRSLLPQLAGCPLLHRPIYHARSSSHPPPPPLHSDTAPQTLLLVASYTRCAYSSYAQQAPPAVALCNDTWVRAFLHHVHAPAARAYVSPAGATALTSKLTIPPQEDVGRRELPLSRPHTQQKPCQRPLTPDANPRSPSSHGARPHHAGPASRSRPSIGQEAQPDQTRAPANGSKSPQLPLSQACATHGRSPLDNWQ